VRSFPRAITKVDIQWMERRQFQPEQAGFDTKPWWRDGFWQAIGCILVSICDQEINSLVRLPETVKIANKSRNIKPGMTAADNIFVNQLHDVLLVPNRAICTENGKRTVYILKNGVATPIEITLGSSSNTQSQLTGGNLAVGDLTILNPPSTTTSGLPSGGGKKYWRSPQWRLTLSATDIVVDAKNLTKVYRAGEIEVTALDGLASKSSDGSPTIWPGKISGWNIR
jgi:hypothetical protein